MTSRVLQTFPEQINNLDIWFHAKADTSLLGAKFTPPSSRDILAAVDSKLGRKWAQSRSSNSPARPPKSSNLEMSPAIAGAANVGASAINQQACGVGMSNDPSNKRASIYSQDSLVTSPSRTTNATFSSKVRIFSQLNINF